MRSVEDVMNRIKKQAKKNAAGEAALERLVQQARAENKTLRAIAEAAKMTPEGIRKMLARTAAPGGTAQAEPSDAA